MHERHRTHTRAISARKLHNARLLLRFRINNKVSGQVLLPGTLQYGALEISAGEKAVSIDEHRYLSSVERSAERRDGANGHHKNTIFL